MSDKTPSRNVMKQVNDVMRDQLGGHVINQIESNTCLLEFWAVSGHVVIVQIWFDRNGWQYYLPGMIVEIGIISEDIKDYLML